MCWQSTILNKQIAAECVPVVKVCELYYPFAVLYSGGAVFYKSPYHSFVYSFSPAEKVNLVVNTHKGSKEFLSGKTYYTIEAGYHCYNPEVNILFDGKDRLYDGFDLATVTSKNGTVVGKYNSQSLVYVEMLIPKGSEYYENEYGEIVASSLKVKEHSKMIRVYESY